MNKYRKWFSCVRHVMEIIWKHVSTYRLFADEMIFCRTIEKSAPSTDTRRRDSAMVVWPSAHETSFSDPLTRWSFCECDFSCGTLLWDPSAVSTGNDFELEISLINVPVLTPNCDFVVPDIWAVYWAATWRRARSHSHPNHSHSPGGNPALREPVCRHFSDCNPSRQQMVLWYLLFSRRSRDLRKKGRQQIALKCQLKRK